MSRAEDSRHSRCVRLVGRFGCCRQRGQSIRHQPGWRARRLRRTGRPSARRAESVVCRNRYRNPLDQRFVRRRADERKIQRPCAERGASAPGADELCAGPRRRRPELARDPCGRGRACRGRAIVGSACGARRRHAAVTADERRADRGGGSHVGTHPWSNVAVGIGAQRRGRPALKTRATRRCTHADRSIRGRGPTSDSACARCGLAVDTSTPGSGCTALIPPAPTGVNN